MMISRTLATAAATLALAGATASTAHAADGHHRGPHRAEIRPAQPAAATTFRTTFTAARGATPTTA